MPGTLNCEKVGSYLQGGHGAGALMPGGRAADHTPRGRKQPASGQSSASRLLRTRVEPRFLSGSQPIHLLGKGVQEAPQAGTSFSGPAVSILLAPSLFPKLLLLQPWPP